MTAPSTMNFLLLNAGSSSLKCSLVDATTGTVVARGMADWAASSTQYQFVGSDGVERSQQVPWKGHAHAVHRFVGDATSDPCGMMRDSPRLGAVGHRVVHGGPFTSSVRITPEIRSRITALADLAPLHNPPSLETVSAAEAELPDVPHVAVFDTAFHATLTPQAYTYPLPHQWTHVWGIRRYGFHGLSHAYCSNRAAEMLDRPSNQLRLVICHLGHGCSASAVRGGACVDTTMGFTPNDGLMMATRCGSLDPGILTHVQQRHGLSPRQIETTLNHESGLLGVSGLSGDMRQVLAAAKQGHDHAQLALNVYTHRVRQAIGALAVTLGGIDALIFTAGVGEHSAEVRSSVCVGLQCLGLVLDGQANATCKPDADVAASGSPARILVIATREDVTMLREVRRVLNHHSS